MCNCNDEVFRPKNGDSPLDSPPNVSGQRIEPSSTSSLNNCFGCPYKFNCQNLINPYRTPPCYQNPGPYYGYTYETYCCPVDDEYK